MAETTANRGSALRIRTHAYRLGCVKPLVLVPYVRVSTAGQADSGLGLADQEAKVRAEADHRGWQLTDLVVDGGESGAGLGRPGLIAALELVAGGKADGLICAKLDRLSRSVMDFAQLLNWFADARATLVVMDPAIDTSTTSGRLVANVFSAVSEWERDVIADRTRDALAALRAQGKAISRPSVVDDADVTARIRAMRADGLTLQAIADSLNAAGVPTVRGAALWRPSAVQAATGYRRPPKVKRLAELPPVQRRRRRAKDEAA